DKIHCLEKFYIDVHPHFIFNINGVKLEKSLLLVHEKNIMIIKYKLLHPDRSLSLTLSPLICIRKIDSDDQLINMKYKVVKEAGYIKYIHSEKFNIFFNHSDSLYTEKKETVTNEFLKDPQIYTSIGEFTYELTPDNDTLYFSISSERIKEADLSLLFDKEINRRTELITKLKIKNELYKTLSFTTDQYLKKENDHYFIKNSLLSPYISFQLMINSFPALISLRKWDQIKSIVRYLADNIKDGLIPESYDKNKKKFQYDSIDNSFRYLLFLFKFIEFTGDWKFVKDFLWEKIKPIFHNFQNNHIENIKIEYDGLLSINLDPDHKFNTGKLIEYSSGKNIALNILWYNAVKIIELLSAKFADIKDHTHAEEISFTIKKNFYYKFWNNEKKYMNNIIDIPPFNKNDEDLTPFQVLTMSLPFDDLIHYKTKESILIQVREKLLTPFGLRTLSPDSKNFIPNFSISQASSSHSGVIHPYLLFHYMTAHMKIHKYSKTAKKEVKYLLINYEKKLKQNNIGFFPQYVNSLPPYESSGLMDLSLSLSEYLRIRHEELGSF
ncbi:MAG: glycogen debranching enzyme N-terminal domain-containing protein, partial [Spirochaetes bacterium]|nr:glycogen debranching enzyme N-terminal domain-containing protein [Spirochaetota bacterium]